ncbi:TolC family outer membrane protein [Castellaniella sp.]|uniref:TolC family outer membrane protein n=1 Tax=Castellaniella sp. TaxID=1955812 RepID=UPI002AFEE801|nr:TolC family outer membrane protein [Castellaniella sp.]
MTLPQAVESAVLSNPEIGAMFQDFQSGVEGQKFDRGRLLPEVNLQGWTGQEWRNRQEAGADADSWSRTGYNLSLRQLVFDGFSTINDVRRLGFEKLSSYYTLQATVDSLAFQASQAYLDIQRYREQVRLARDNFKMHEDILLQIAERSASGVGRGVDEVQADARLQLAQTNVMTATGNLNDIVQRFQRIVGQVPPDILTDSPNLSDGIPESPKNFNQALRVNPAILAKQALVQAAQHSKSSAQGRFSPVLELRASTGRDQNQAPGVAGRDTQSSNVQLMMNFNLYRGGADSARVRQTAAHLYAARDVRDYTCRNVQQELSIAWNNVVRLRQQMPFLIGHERAISQVQIAYTQQFKIGERSLLDLLDTENELFDARKALTDGIYDLQIAEYEWLSQAHELLPKLGLSDPYPEQPDEAAKLEFPDETLQACVTPLPDRRALEPIQVQYQADAKPPVLQPVGSVPAGWN